MPAQYSTKDRLKSGTGGIVGLSPTGSAKETAPSRKTGTKKLQIIRKLGDKKFPPVTINDENCYNNELIKKIINILNEHKYFNY